MKFELLLTAFASLGVTIVVVAQPPSQSLDDALSTIFDSNKDGLISKSELKKTMDMVAMMAGDSELTHDASEIETRSIVDTALNAAPVIFEFLDSDSSNTLSRNELKWANTIKSGFLSGAMRNLTREVFAAINTNEDDFLDASELDTAASTDSKVLSTIVGLVHTAYPVRKNVDDLKSMVQQGISALNANGSSASDGISYIDTNKDGKIDKKEAVKAYLDLKKKFLKAAKTIIQMAPMAAMMSGMGGMDGGGMNVEL
mmetsp:Transcript_28288/g.31794  ORF Transcript_28288/g.31794 Transcript_28288/m.31794 type:complete len:257 (+) Transcript_28288:191-961(+)|eukprot:CAMPEP_0170781106 /NCGR_PEP_ID=MMETSP0733-20121128/14004_1 /TAXON_ID=186038 /ORGANISM="Fragilariopsis kerguelensis, Strain L26-C5" /LENGTH=256 /DNA_ID=CAMNT_0011125087 /DNA_START=324 /DNA_END=1094 /DNA_ORIENTATION=+